MVIVVGGGISGVACAGELNARGITVELLDRGHKLGGRMASRVIRDSGTEYDGHVVDIGASYFTASAEGFRAVVDDWQVRGLARVWTDSFHLATPQGVAGVRAGPMRYAAAGGLRSLVADLASRLPSTRITSNHSVEVVSFANDYLIVDGKPVAGVALCMPDPQARAILDSKSPELQATIEATCGVVWEPTFAVTAVFQNPCWVPFDGVFVNDDEILTWIANDGSRRGDDAPVLVAHVNPVLAAGHLADPAAVIPSVLAALQRILALTEQPIWVDIQRWTYAKPLNAWADECYLDGDVNIGLASDAWAGGPRVETAWQSGAALGKRIAERLASPA